MTIDATSSKIHCSVLGSMITGFHLVLDIPFCSISFIAYPKPRSNLRPMFLFPPSPASFSQTHCPPSFFPPSSPIPSSFPTSRHHRHPCRLPHPSRRRRCNTRSRFRHRDNISFTVKSTRCRLCPHRDIGTTLLLVNVDYHQLFSKLTDLPHPLVFAFPAYRHFSLLRQHCSKIKLLPSDA